MEEQEAETETKIDAKAENKKKRRSKQEKDALPKKQSKNKKEEEEEPVEVKMEVEEEKTETETTPKVNLIKGKEKKSAKSAEKKTPKSNKKTREKKTPKSKEKSPKIKSESPKQESKSPKKEPESPKSAEKSPQKEDSKKSPEKNTSKTETPKAKLNPFAAMMGKSPATSTDTKDGKQYEDIVKKSRYDPIEDAIWKKDQKTPYLAFSKTLQAIEATSGRLKTTEILANFFRSVMVLSPDDLLPSVYMCLNKIAPAYEGKELGIGETLLIKAIAQTTGRSVQQIKADVGKKGDLGIVAETSKGSQRTMFQPAPLTVQSVFEKLKSIAAMTGNQSMGKKVEKIQAMLVACKGSESRYLIRSLAGKLRIGLAEQSVLQALAHACVMTPPAQEYPPETLTAFKDCTSDRFKEALEPEALKLKTAYW